MILYLIDVLKTKHFLETKLSYYKKLKDYTSYDRKRLLALEHNEEYRDNITKIYNQQLKILDKKIYIYALKLKQKDNIK